LTLLVTGTGQPITVVAHGLGASLPESRALASGIGGTKLFPQARGHGDAPPPVNPGYQELADDLLAVADEHHATQAFGTSMGAHALLRILASYPARFDRLVLFLPAAIDTPVRRPPALADALAAGDREAVLSAVQADLGTSREEQAYAAMRTDFLLASPGLVPLLRALPGDVPVADRSVLGAVTAETLVIGQEGDGLHPAAVARELAAALPRARLEVFDRPAVLTERARFRALVSDHLAGANRDRSG
jgi:pimeloyl-ACP methyl ester carboxylesterase